MPGWYDQKAALGDSSAGAEVLEVSEDLDGGHMGRGSTSWSTPETPIPTLLDLRMGTGFSTSSAMGTI
jgi:hypothetical protein